MQDTQYLQSYCMCGMMDDRAHISDRKDSCRIEQDMQTECTLLVGQGSSKDDKQKLWWYQCK